MNNTTKLGVIGGVGPLATVIFMKKVIDLKNADCDQDNINMVVLNDTSIPDRTAYLLGQSHENPLDYLLKDIKYLEQTDCKYVTILCNTAHKFYDELQASTSLEIINMVEVTLRACHEKNYHHVGLMATRGTINTKTYEMFNKFGLTIFTPEDSIQSKIDEMIFDRVKKNILVKEEEFNSVLDYFYESGCDSVILGCTELSVIIDYLNIDNDSIIDSTSEVVKRVIELCS